MKKIYCAGPLFNTKEKEEMHEIAFILEENGFKVFLPQRDGFEFANLSQAFNELGLSKKDANLLLNKAIFTLDVFQVLNSNGLVLNINGRVPDEGALVEAGIAWNAGKKVVIYKNDARTLINGNDNPLLLGLANFVTLNEIPRIPGVFKELFGKDDKDENPIINNSHLKDLYIKGKHISSLAKKNQDKSELCYQLIKILGDNNVQSI
ncbi:MAG: nucleoside 2-deoxyribosyltransferase [Nitrospinota bacterium]